MPKRKEHYVQHDDIDVELVQVRKIFKQLGRALALTAMAVKAGERLEDEAIEAMDGAWLELADLAIELADGGNWQ